MKTEQTPTPEQKLICDMVMNDIEIVEFGLIEMFNSFIMRKEEGEPGKFYEYTDEYKGDVIHSYRTLLDFLREVKKFRK